MGAKNTEVVPHEPSLNGAARSMVSLRIGTRSYSAVRHARCKICTHPARVQIEERLLYNETYGAIVEWGSGVRTTDADGEPVTWPVYTVLQLTTHFNNGHCPIDARVLHELTEQRGAAVQADYEEAAGRIVDHVITLRQVVARGQERLVRGELEPDVKDVIAASRALGALEVAADQADQADNLTLYEQAMEIYFSEARRIMNPDQWAEFSSALSVHPVLVAMSRRQVEGDVVDAEVVEEGPR